MSIFIGKHIEVTHINLSQHIIGFVIHLPCNPADMELPDNQLKTLELVQKGARYLQDEGFIPPNLQWITHVGRMPHHQGI